MRTLIAAASLTLLTTTALAKPNIVVIMTDDQVFDSVETMPKTKSLLAEQGVTFVNSFSAYPLCGPARAAFLTGQYPHTNGIQRSDQAYDLFLGREDNSLAPWLHAQGYATMLDGKYLNGDGHETHVPPGWDRTVITTSYKYFGYGLMENGVETKHGFADEDYSTDVLGGKAIDFINAQTGPFFLLLTPFAPHRVWNSFAVPAPRHVGQFGSLPLPMPKSFNEFDVSDKPGKVKEIWLMTGAEQASMVEEFHDKRESLLAVDDMVENVIDALGTKIDDTIIVFTSDNGWSQGYHRWVGKQVGYEESARVPLIIRWPGMPQNETRDQLVTSLDVVATIVDAAKATPGNPIEGHSLVPVLRHADAPWRTAAVLEGGNYPNWGYSQLRSARISYSEWNSDDYGPEKELYDLAEDPLELKNRVQLDRNRYRKVQEFMGGLLAAKSACAGEDCWITTPVPDPHPKK